MQKRWIGRHLDTLRVFAAESLSAWLKPESRKYPSSNPESTDFEKLRRTLSQLILVRLVILTTLLVTTAWDILQHGAAQPDTHLVFWSIAITYAISGINATWLWFTKRLKQFGYGQFTVDVLLATLAIYVTNSAMSISLYLLIIVAAALVFSRHGTVVIAAFSGLCYAVLTSGLLPSPHGHTITASPADILGVYISLVVIAVISGYLAKQLEIVGSIADTNAKNYNKLNKRQEQLFNDISDGIITIDIGATVTSINEAACAIMGLADLDANNFVGRPLRTAFREHGVSGLEQLVNDNDGCQSAEITIQGPPQNREIHLSYSIKPLTDENGNESGKLLIFDDVSHVRNIQERLDLHERMTKLLSETSSNPSEGAVTQHSIQMIGESPVMNRVFALVERVAASNASVLITGESGTGKELIAKAIHANSTRKEKPFIAINCGAIPENLIESELFGHKKGSFTGAISDNPGLFKQAHLGTIFLDEIGELPLHLQTKLLRVLQDKVVRAVGDTRDTPLDVRIIAATNRDLKKQISAGQFREDLFYRLNVVNIPIPPLRERPEDIPPLVQHFVAHCCGQDQTLPQISPEALQLLLSYSYPGNVRELENIVERMLVLGGKAVLAEHLPDEVIAAGQQRQLPSNGKGSQAVTTDRETAIVVLPINLEDELAKLEKQYLLRALHQSGGIKKHAAELLGLNFRSFRYRMKKYGLNENTEEIADDNN